MPLWKRLELARDPDFKDLHEQVAGKQAARGQWSYPRGYALTIREEAALLKAGTRAAATAAKPQTQKKYEQHADSQSVVRSCGCFG